MISENEPNYDGGTQCPSDFTEISLTARQRFVTCSLKIPPGRLQRPDILWLGGDYVDVNRRGDSRFH